MNYTESKFEWQDQIHIQNLKKKNLINRAQRQAISVLNC